jgi:hypothetical protein
MDDVHYDDDVVKGIAVSNSDLEPTHDDSPVFNINNLKRWRYCEDFGKKLSPGAIYTNTISHCVLDIQICGVLIKSKCIRIYLPEDIFNKLEVDIRTLKDKYERYVLSIIMLQDLTDAMNALKRHVPEFKVVEPYLVDFLSYDDRGVSVADGA